MAFGNYVREYLLLNSNFNNDVLMTPAPVMIQLMES